MMEVNFRVDIERIPHHDEKCDRGNVLFFPWFLRLTVRCHSLYSVHSDIDKSNRTHCLDTW